MRRRSLRCVLAALALGLPAFCEDLTLGKIVDNVECQANARQHYALYLPSNYSPTRRWSVVFIFDAGGRGRRGVERYQSAAEKYGYILAGSNNSRNGSWKVSLDAAAAMMGDVEQRFAVDSKRVYTAGMSGGARVALKVALESGGKIAGVMASSAGWPGERQTTAPFPVFASMGTDDFNYLELRALDRTLTTPHRVMLFDGPHTWLPAELATQAIEWMELQAMRGGQRARDAGLADRLFAIRVAQIESDTDSLTTLRDLKAIVADFEGLKDVKTYADRAAALESRKDTREAIEKQNASEEHETQLTSEIYELRDSLPDYPARHDATLAQLRDMLHRLAAQSKAAGDSEDRRIARRILSVLGAGEIEDPGLQDLLKDVRPAPAAPPN
jgi:predicted esterase